MKIKNLKFHPIAVADGPLRSSYGLHASYALRTIAEVGTTDGITGISETYGGDRPLAALESVRERVEGMDPFQLTAFRQYIAAQANHHWGGIRAQQKLSDLCESLGLGMSMHSNNHPGKPGLGVTLDYDQVARKRDDEAEMRKHVDPN